MRIFIPVLALLVVAGCSSKVSTTGGSTSGGKYTEDLSGLRTTPVNPADTVKTPALAKTSDTKRDPSKYVEARHAVNGSLDAVLDSIDRINVSKGVVDGFTIQLYSGIKREDALDVKKQLATALPQIDAEVQFVQPNFRVRAGKYINRFDAHKDFMSVKKYFPNAIIIPDRISIRQ